jgi:hypothetical protein
MLSKLFAAFMKKRFSTPFKLQLLNGGKRKSSLENLEGSSTIRLLQYLFSIIQIQSRVSATLALFFKFFASKIFKTIN